MMDEERARAWLREWGHGDTGGGVEDSLTALIAEVRAESYAAARYNVILAAVRVCEEEAGRRESITARNAARDCAEGIRALK